MNHTFHLKIIASDKVFFEGRSRFVVLPQEDGEKAIAAHHENTMFALIPGEVRFQTEDEKWIIAAVSSGFAQVINNRVMVLVFTAERPEDIDLVRAQQAKERAEEEMRQKQSQQEYYSSQMALSRAINRLRVGEHKRIRRS